MRINTGKPFGIDISCPSRQDKVANAELEKDRVAAVITYGIREFKARASEILRKLDDGEEVIITRRGKPCGKLVTMLPQGREKGSVKTLMGAFKGILPEAAYEDFQEVKGI